MKKVTQPERPERIPDHYSKRNVPYWWSPEWIRGLEADYERMDGGKMPAKRYGRVKAIKNGEDVDLHGESQEGNHTFIRGSIQQEFKKWHLDRSIDYILLGEDPDEIIK